MKIELADARDFARGAAFLGTGGGGDPYIGRLLLEQALKRRGPARVIPVTELDDDAFVVPIAGMGAPTVISRRSSASARASACCARSSSASAARRPRS
jgi:DUF917 family protein